MPVRSYVNELEYVDDVQNAAVTVPEAEPQLLEHSTAASASAVSSAADSEADAQGNSFHMESESDFSEDDALGITTMLELPSTGTEEVNTDVMRAMALEIHEAAQLALPEDAAEIDGSFVEMDSEAEAEMEIDPSVLTPAEVAQAIADAKADAADAAAEKADAIEAAKDAKEAAATAAPAAPATPAPTTPAPTVLAPTATAAPAAPAAAKPAAPAAAPVSIALPADMSLEHAETLRTSEAATFAIRGALGEVGAILSAKDDTIAGLVANISYITVNMGRLANQVDVQRSYINLLLRKLAIAQIKNAELANHVALSSSTVASVRAQIGAMESRLASQNSVTQALAQSLSALPDSSAASLPAAPAAIAVTGARTSLRSIRDRFVSKARKAAAARRAARAAALAERQKAYALRRAQRQARQRSRRALQRSRRSRRRAAVRKAMRPVAVANGPIPTIVVEIPDTGMIEESSE